MLHTLALDLSLMPLPSSSTVLHLDMQYVLPSHIMRRLYVSPMTWFICFPKDNLSVMVTPRSFHSAFFHDSFITQENTSLIIVYWFYQTPSCYISLCQVLLAIYVTNHFCWGPSLGYTVFLLGLPPHHHSIISKRTDSPHLINSPGCHPMCTS